MVVLNKYHENTTAKICQRPISFGAPMDSPRGGGLLVLTMLSMLFPELLHVSLPTHDGGAVSATCLVSRVRLSSKVCRVARCVGASVVSGESLWK